MHIVHIIILAGGCIIIHTTKCILTAPLVLVKSMAFLLEHPCRDVSEFRVQWHTMQHYTVVLTSQLAREDSKLLPANSLADSTFNLARDAMNKKQQLA